MLNPFLIFIGLKTNIGIYANLVVLFTKNCIAKLIGAKKTIEKKSDDITKQKKAIMFTDEHVKNIGTNIQIG